MKVTTRDIARIAGVSQATVSVVLNNNTSVSISADTRMRVMKIAEEMGYQHKKRNDSSSKVPVVGLMVPTLSNLYYASMIQSVESYAKSLGLTIVLQNTMRDEEKERRCFDYFRRIGVNGILCLFSPKTQLPGNIPVVLVGERLPGIDVDTVSLNCFVAGQLAAEHLLSLGHKHIAYISTPFSNMTDARRKRYEGIQSVMKKHGLLENLVLMVDDTEDETAETAYEFDCGARLTAEILKKHKECTAIIAVNDMTAWGCISELKCNNVPIPERMAICGFDNLLHNRLIRPQLTSIDQMAFHGCKIGLSVLMQKINKSDSGEESVYMEYEPKLFARASTLGICMETPANDNSL